MMLKLLSLGCGRQSSRVYLGSMVGEYPKLDAAIFADTGDEPESVYKYLEYLISLGGPPIHVVKRKGYPSISEHLAERQESGRRADNPPLWSIGDDGRESCIVRDCTREWKIKVIERKVKELLGLSWRGRWPDSISVEMWMGIARDEWRRMRSSEHRWQRFWYPLIEEQWPETGRPKVRTDAETTEDCLRWISEQGFREPPRSACWHCPYRSNAHWRILRDTEPESWAKAVAFDHSLRSGPRLHGMENEVFLHRSLTPLGEANIEEKALPLFDDECEGMCGV